MKCIYSFLCLWICIIWFVSYVGRILCSTAQVLLTQNLIMNENKRGANWIDIKLTFNHPLFGFISRYSNVQLNWLQ